jgi:hypothetical protein
MSKSSIEKISRELLSDVSVYLDDEEYVIEVQATWLYRNDISVHQLRVFNTGDEMKRLEWAIEDFGYTPDEAFEMFRERLQRNIDEHGAKGG